MLKLNRQLLQQSNVSRVWATRLLELFDKLPSIKSIFDLKYGEPTVLLSFQVPLEKSDCVSQ